MKNVNIVSKVVARKGEALTSPSKDHSTANLSDYLLKSIWDKIFEVRTDSQGTEYIFGKLPVVTQYGITMYSGEGVNVPNLASGLPFDGRTIWYNPDTQQIEVIGGTGGGSGEGVSNFWDLSGIPSWITNSKPKYTYSEIEGTPDLSVYAKNSDVTALSGKLNDFLEGSDTDTIINKWKELEVFLNGLSESDSLATILSSKVGKDYVDGNFVTLGTTQSILGEKDFVGGLKVNGSPIYYDTEKKYWKLEGDLLVTGGVTMYGSDSSFTPSTIMDAIAVDGTTISKDGGVLKVIGGTGGGVADSVAWANITGKPTWIGSSKPSYSYSEITGAISTTELQNYLTQNSYLNVTEGDNRYLKLSGGTINGKLTIKNSTREVLDIISTDIYGPLVKLCYYNDVALSLFGHIRKATESNLGAYWMNNESGCGIMLGSDGKTYIFTNQTVKAEHEIWHKGNFTPSNYLPLSGGTISNNGYALILNRESENPVWIQFRTQNEFVGAIGGENGALRFMDKNSKVNTIWHSGNDGSGSGLNADLLDGIDSSLMFYARNGRITADNVNATLENGVYYTSGYSPISGAYSYGTFLNFRSNVVGTNARQTQFYIPDGAQWEQSNRGARLYIRDLFNASDNIWTEWHEIITDSRIGHYNAGSATKLQTARTIWGKSFDGTGNVDGRIRVLQDVQETFSEEIVCSLLVYANSPYGLVTRTYNNGSMSLQVQRESNNNETFPLLLNPLGGNVGIGTPNPKDKLDVNGNIIANEYYALTPSGGKYPKFRLISDQISDSTWLQSANAAGTSASGILTLSGMYGNDLALCKILGPLLVTHGITMYSDQRKKTILNHVELSLKQIAEAPLIEHYYNSDEKKTTHVGSIAQYWASMNDWFCKLDNEGYYTMEIQNAALASAISIARELDRYETKTDKAIKKLKKRICELEEEVERLKAS